MGALRTAGVAVLVAGIVGLAMFGLGVADWAFGILGGLPVGARSGPPAHPLMVLLFSGMLWGPLLLALGLGLLYVSARRRGAAVWF